MKYVAVIPKTSTLWKQLSDQLVKEQVPSLGWQLVCLWLSETLICSCVTFKQGSCCSQVCWPCGLPGLGCSQSHRVNLCFILLISSTTIIHAGYVVFPAAGKHDPGLTQNRPLTISFSTNHACSLVITTVACGYNKPTRMGPLQFSLLSKAPSDIPAGALPRLTVVTSLGTWQLGSCHSFIQMWAG